MGRPTLALAISRPAHDFPLKNGFSGKILAPSRNVKMSIVVLKTRLLYCTGNFETSMFASV